MRRRKASGWDPGVFQLGRYLAAARERAGLAREEVAQYVGIPSRYVVLIEEGRLDLLPDPSHARGYVRTYAAAVGLDQEAVTLFLCRLRRGSSFVEKDLGRVVKGLRPRS
jgi:transcriptional regulator with XRE-family HTH domain